MPSNTERVKIPTKEQMERQTDILEGIRHGIEALVESGINPSDITAYDSIFEALLDGTNTTRVFEAWYPRALAAQAQPNRYALLERWFTILEKYAQHKTYTVRFYDPAVSSSDQGTPMDDLAEMSGPAQLCTEATEAVKDWADEDPFTWYVYANAISLADGTMNILAIDGVDTDYDESGETAPVYAFQAAWWIYDRSDGEYRYVSYRMSRAAGYTPLEGDIAPTTNEKRIMTWHPATGGCQNSDGGLTSGFGKAPYIYASANSGIVAARSTGEYEGLWGDTDTKWLLYCWALRHWTLGNSGHADGCISYNYQYEVSAAETSVHRIIVTTAQGANFLVGSSVALGDASESTGHDRNDATMHNIFGAKRILSKETVTLNGTDYTALNIESDEAFTVPTGAWVSTMPWFTGDTQKLPEKKDGCTVSLTGGKTPLRVAGIEVLDGALATGLDPLYQVTANAESGFDYAVYSVRDSEKQAGSITSDYVNTGIGATGVASGWNYVKKFVNTVLGVLFPEEFGGSSSGYYKDAFIGPYSAGVRIPARFGYLAAGTYAGLAYESASHAPSAAGWHYRPRLSGSGKKRGEWQG